MQLRGKKIGILVTIVIYCFTFLIQSNFLFFQTRAQERNVPRVNIVAILVDDKIYGKIENGLKRYASEYIQGKLADTKALVLPLNLDNIKAYDIHRMMENIYFDGLKDVNSQLIGLIMFGDIPLPVVNQDGYVFPTVYPYVDFENQKYVWDTESQYFIPNGNPEGQAEIWHGLINYGTDTQSYLKFFNKIQNYLKNPDDFIGDGMWYEDFVAQKQAFLDDNYQYYRNKIMFGEDIGYQRYSPLMKSLFSTESQDNSLELISELSETLGVAFEGMDGIENVISQSSEDSHTTKMIQQEIETSMLADYNELFGKNILSTIRENIFAGGRWIKLSHDSNGKATQIVNADNSASKIQLKDTMYLGNENLQGLIENLNFVMEEMIDKKIADNKYDMDIVIPVSYEKISGRRISSGLHRSCYRFVERFDNYYFGNNARFIDKAEDLSIYRGTYRNLLDLNGVTFESLKGGDNPSIGIYDSTNLKLKSVGSSYDIFSNQAEGNRGYMLSAVERDLNVYDDKKTLKNGTVGYRGRGGKVVDIVWPEGCGGDQICEDLFDFAKRWWGGASPINLDTGSVSSGRYQLSGYKATDSWRYIFDLGGFQSLLSGDDEGMLGKGWIDGNGVGPQNAATSFKAYVKYSSPTQRQGWRSVGRNRYERYNNNTPDVHIDVSNMEIDFSKMNYWNLDKDIINNWKITKESPTSKIFSIAPKSVSLSCRWSGRRTMSTKYTYKVVSSVVKHVSTTDEQINGIDKNKYGEGGTLWSYYIDLKNAYENVANNVNDILESLKAQKTAIKTQNDKIGDILKSLNGESDKLKNLEEGKKDLEGEDIESDKDESEEKSIDEKIGKFLNEIDSSLNQEKKDLSKVFGLISSLSADEIPAIMEYIANEEDISPEDFYAGKENLMKIGFSSEWISELKSSKTSSYETKIKNGANEIIVVYEDVYKLIENQKENRKLLASQLMDYSSVNSDKIDKISEKFDNIFVVSGEDSDLEDGVEDLGGDFSMIGDAEEDSKDESDEITLTQFTVQSVIRSDKKMNCSVESDASDEEGTVGILTMFDGECGIDEMFNWLIEEDKVAPKIEQAAKNDNDFKKWLSKNSIDSSKFTQADWINQYAAWTQGPGYDSKGAKENHDLLLGVSEHIPGMNILTPDRPIDSPRYVSIQSVAGNEIKFIYPDLFKVEVYALDNSDKDGYESHKLLSKGEIKNNIVRYLKGKVSEYNLILNMERNRANMTSFMKTEYYSRLSDNSYWGATPTLNSSVRPYDSFTYKEFVDALGGENMLDAIADILYYQSLTNKKKLSSGLISEDIDLIKDSFNINDKREQVLEDYLIEGNEKSLNPVMVIPTYQPLGYEVAYVNSNGKDYIIPDADEDDGALLGLTKSKKTEELYDLRLNNVADLNGSEQEKKLNDECNIPPSGKLPLFELKGTSSISSPWFEGFMCWLKKTKETPLTVKLTFDSSLGEILMADSLKDYVKNSELGQSLSDWGDARSQYVDEWDTVIEKKSDFDSDKVITQKQVDAEKHNIKYEGGDDGVSNLMSKISKNLVIGNTNATLSDSNPVSVLTIGSLVDFGVVTIEFIGMGDGCLKINNDVLCDGKSVTKTFNPKIDPFKVLVESNDHKAGKVALDLKVLVGGEYVEKVIKYTVSPSELNEKDVDIIFGDKNAVAGMMLPVEIVGHDKYGNKVSRGLEKYRFTVSLGKFFKDGAYQESFETNDFRNLKFYYQAPLDVQDGAEAIIQISKVKDSDSYIKTQPISIVKAAPEIKINSKKINLDEIQTYKLKSDESIYIGNKLNISKLQKLDIDIKDSKGRVVDVDSQVIVTSQNGLVVIGQVQQRDGGESVFFETSKNYIVDGHVTVYYYPTTVAGDDIINVNIPGLDVRKINLSILPSSLANVLILPESEILELGDSMDVEIFLADVWGNSVKGSNVINLDFDEDKLEIEGYKGAKDSIELSVNDGYTKLSVLGVGAGLTYIIGGGTYAEINVDKHLFPDSNLNIMYLNYFGNDRGNQWGYFSDNNKYIENLMKKSNKVITTTTQLISEDKIKRMIWKIGNGFKIWNPDNIDTSVLLKDNNLNMVIGGISSMKVSLPSAVWMTVSQEEFQEKMEGTLGKTSGIFFVPSDSKYSVDKNGLLYEDGVNIFNILGGDITLYLSDEVLENGDNVRTVKDKGTVYGNLIIHYPSFKPSISKFDISGKGYVVNSTFSDGSTNDLSSVGIFDITSEFELSTSYKSIQDSDQVDERIGFLGDFKNITLFAEGEIVGEATKKYGSEFVINLGDPVLSRKDLNNFVYGTRFDGGIGSEIYVDSEKDIFGTYQIDFNNDSLKDLLVVYLDGTIKLAKNYGGTPDLRNMQELMRIAVSIKDVFVGDVDGNKYDDIVIRTSNNQLRAYLNTGGIFDVDGSVACLNQNVLEGDQSSTPSQLDGIFQLFVEDMDLDGIMDIVTYDKKGYIKVFYGGTTKGGPNYLSTDKYSCDSGWYERENSNTSIVTALGVQISGDSIFDNSMLHWEGMEQKNNPLGNSIPGDEISDYGIDFDPQSFANEDILKTLIKTRDRNSDGDISGIMNEIIGKFDVSKASQQYVNEGIKFVDVTLYENELMGGGDGNNYVFAPISFLDPNNPEDKGSVWKNYSVKNGSKILQDGDIVTVRVTIKASNKDTFRGAYGDVIQGPWKLYFDDNQVFKGIRFIRNPSNAVVKKKDGNFAYIIDNIILSPGDKLVFEYDLEYKAIPLKSVSITYNTYYSQDNYPDIKGQSVDGCDKNFDVYVNAGKGRSFSKENVPLQDMINKEYLKEEDNTKDYTEDILKAGSDINQLPGIIKDKISRVSLLGGKSVEISNDESGKLDLKKVLNEAGISLNIDLQLFEKETEEIESVIDDITQGMCNGFSFGGSSNCKGLPVPFNQAFLAPGKYHLFGCWQLPMGPLEGGVPSFFFPGTLWVTVLGAPVSIPFPYGFKSPTDGFLWIGQGSAPYVGGVFPSMIRIYAAPTLTAQLGVAVCAGPYMNEYMFPSPLADVAGNCVVFAVKPQCKSGGSLEDGLGGDSSDLDNPNETYVDYIEDVRDSGVCLQSQKGPQVTEKNLRSSPFDLHSFSVQEKQSNSRKNFSWVDTRDTITWKNMDVSGGSHNDVEYETSFMGIIELETSSFIGGLDSNADNVQNSIIIGDVDILGGEFSVNKIKGGLQQGVRKMLIDKWLDPQIRYILNQLTKMHINIKLPDISGVIDDVSSIKDIADNMGNGESESKENSKLEDVGTRSKWEGISRDSLNAMNQKIANPFEALASLTNESNIINISTETLAVKVPMIFAEDINAYEFYLKQWLEVNEQIVNRWDFELRNAVTICSTKPETEQESCREIANKNLESFVKFQEGEWKKMQNQIHANLVVLQQYRNFPFEIYEWIHVMDRYMSEIASLINNTIGYLSYWTSTNSKRFVGYVDAIVLIVNIIKTYQLLINFPVEWSQNCGNCSKDTYDQYSCKLSMLCDMIKLPIIQIPNFKLPNITIDLSNVDLSLDIVLPKFNFQPVKVNLPELPNLPEPPTLSLDVNVNFFNLPTIPVLPEPPELPELPSFIPEVELSLPVLPPAPEVPRLPDSIEAAIKTAKLIGKIFCIVKGQFGLVGESSVKAKIEQLTQRTYEVSWIDNIMDFTNVSAAPIHNYGVDYEIDSYLDLQFNFTDFYDYLDSLTKSINNLTTSTVNNLNSEVDDLMYDNKLREALDSVDDESVEFQVNVGDKEPISMTDINGDIDGLVSGDIEYVDYDDAKARLKDVLAYFRQEINNTSFRDSMGSSIDKIENQIDRNNSIIANEEGIENLRKTVMNYLDEQKVNYDEIANLINYDYDGFLAMVDAQSSDENIKGVGDSLLAFNVQLFNVDSSTKDTLNYISKNNPYQSLVENKQTIIDGYRNAINTSSAEDLGLTNTQYLVMRDNISSMKQQINILYSLTKPVSSTNLIAKNSVESSNKTLFAGITMGGSKKDIASVIDPSVFSKGIYEKIVEGKDKGKLTKVVYSDSFAESMSKTHYSTTHSQDHDVILWDENSIYQKCYDQSCLYYGGSFRKYYNSVTIDEVPNEEKWIDFDSETKLKIADKYEEVKDLEVVGQSYDALSFAWTLNDSDAYLIKLVERVDSSYEKSDYLLKAPAHYVLALPNYADLEAMFDSGYKLELLNKKIDTIQNLSGNDLLQIVYYDANKSSVNVSLSDIDRKWYYARISSLDLEDNTYVISSPWSNQVVAGRQIIGDDLSPLGDAVLYRTSIGEVVSEGDELEGYVGTEYRLIVNWDDNVSLSYIDISKDGKVLNRKYTMEAEDFIDVKIDIRDKSGTEMYVSRGVDQFGNQTEKIIKVSYYVPGITVTDVSRSSDGKTVSIEAELTQDIDQGNVSFQRKRGTNWKTMKGDKSQTDIPVGVSQRVVRDSYTAGDEIAMYSKDGQVMALMSPDTAEIKIQPNYKADYGVNVVVQDGAVLQLYNNKTNEIAFSLSIPAQECKNIEAEGYVVESLPNEGNMGMFNGGKVIYRGGSNVLFISSTCRLYSELGMVGTYSYDRELGAVMLTLYELSDSSKSNPIKIWFKVKPLMES